MPKKHLLFIAAGGLGGGFASLAFGLSEVWIDGGTIVVLSGIGRLLFFINGLLSGSICAGVISLIARQYLDRTGGLAQVVIGVVLGALGGLSSCVCLSVVFFTFPFPRLFELLTRKQ